MYEIEPGVLVTPWATPEDLFLPSPVPAHDLLGSAVQAPWLAAFRNFSTFSVVPDSSDRKNTEILLLGRFAPGFSSAIAEAFQVVILPVKIWASTSGVRA